MPLTLERVVPAHVELRTVATPTGTMELDRSVSALGFVDDDTLFCGSADHTCSLWSVGSATRRFVFTAKMHAATCVAVSADGKLAVSGHGSWGGVCLWDLERGALVHQLDESLMYVSAVGFFQPRVGDAEVIAHVGGGLLRWSVVSGALVKADDHRGKKFPTAFTAAQVLCALPKGTTLSTLPAEKKLRDLDAVPRAQCAAFSSDGARAGVGGDGGVVRVFDVGTGTVLYAKDAGGYGDTVKAIALSGDLVALGTQAGAVVVVHGSVAADPVAVDAMSIRALAFSPSGRRLAVGCFDGNVRVFAVG